MNKAQADRAAAQAEIDAVSKRAGTLDVAEIYAMIDSLGDVGATLAEAKPTTLNRLYRELNVSAAYLPEERAVDVTARPRVDSARVRGGSCALTTRLLDDLSTFLGNERVPAADVPARLRDLTPGYEPYQRLTGVKLREVLEREYGIKRS